VSPAADALGVAATVRAGASALEATEQRLDAIAAREELGAFWAVDRDGACAEAIAVDDALRTGRDPGPFAGATVAWKDCFDVAGLPTTAGSSLFGAVPAARDAAVVVRARAAGAVCVGKLAMHALAWGMMGWAHRRPPCPNPYDRTRTAGGSSNGSAVAVATGLVDLAPGTDAGGSIRVPASLCGVVGMKPTHGVVPLDGCLPLTRTLDHAGPIARSVRDCGASLAVLAAHGTQPPPAEPLAGVRIGVLERHFCEQLDPGVERAFGAALEALSQAGAALVPVDLGWQDDADVLLPLFLCEPLPMLADAVTADPEAFGADVVEDVTRGLQVGAVDYLRALDRLEARRRRALPSLADVDLVACPTVPIGPPPLEGPDRTRDLNRNTKPFNGLRWPAISIPCGRDDEGFPVGLQLAAAPGEDWRLLGLARSVEDALGGPWPALAAASA
jgi:aspartyl-tRNA(Asn)/glutamyl-tRNA(Gln) amidotransferase subunit A